MHHLTRYIIRGRNEVVDVVLQGKGYSRLVMYKNGIIYEFEVGSGSGTRDWVEKEIQYGELPNAMGNNHQ